MPSGTVCRAVSPARFSARSMTERVQVAEIAVAGLAQHFGREIAGGHFRRQLRFIKRLFLGQCRVAAGGEEQRDGKDQSSPGEEMREHLHRPHKRQQLRLRHSR